MRVLVMGAPGPVTEGTVARIEAAGHVVVRCTDPGEACFPCKGLTGECPFDIGETVDAALALRNHAWPRPTAFDRGVTCAVRLGIPVVLAGVNVLNPYERWAAAVLERADDPVTALERVAVSVDRSGT